MCTLMCAKLCTLCKRVTSLYRVWRARFTAARPHKGDTKHQQVPQLSRGRDHGPDQSRAPRPLPQLETHTLAPALPLGRQLQDPYARQRQPRWSLSLSLSLSLSRSLSLCVCVGACVHVEGHLRISRTSVRPSDVFCVCQRDRGDVGTAPVRACVKIAKTRQTDFHVTHAACRHPPLCTHSRACPLCTLARACLAWQTTTFTRHYGQQDLRRASVRVTLVSLGAPLGSPEASWRRGTGEGRGWGEGGGRVAP